MSLNVIGHLHCQSQNDWQLGYVKHMVSRSSSSSVIYWLHLQNWKSNSKYCCSQQKLIHALKYILRSHSKFQAQNIVFPNQRIEMYLNVWISLYNNLSVQTQNIILPGQRIEMHSMFEYIFTIIWVSKLKILFCTIKQLKFHSIFENIFSITWFSKHKILFCTIRQLTYISMFWYLITILWYWHSTYCSIQLQKFHSMFSYINLKILFSSIEKLNWPSMFWYLFTIVWVSKLKILFFSKELICPSIKKLKYTSKFLYFLTILWYPHSKYCLFGSQNWNAPHCLDSSSW